MTFLATCDAKWFFKDATKKLLNILCAQKLKKLKSEIIQIPHHMEMCRWHFQGFTEIQNGRHGPASIFFLGGGSAETQKISLVNLF